MKETFVGPKSWAWRAVLMPASNWATSEARASRSGALFLAAGINGTRPWVKMNTRGAPACARAEMALTYAGGGTMGGKG